MRILVVEDERRLAGLIKKALEREKYAVDVVYDGREALAFAWTYPYDLILLDILLPEKNGYEVVRELRSKKISSPVLMLTAMDAVEDKIQGLDLGADDYLTKPFDFGELLARIRALLRRDSGEKAALLRAGDLILDPRTHRAERAGKTILLTTREYCLLEFLMRKKNRVLSRDVIIDHVWDSSFDSLANIVDVYIRYLRKKMDTGFSRKLIQTVRGVGYMMRDKDED